MIYHADIAKYRIANQQISGTKLNSVTEIVGWMGAMQAQDYAMAKWAIGVRLPGSTEKIIEDAFNQGKILRTHVLRPTWHFVAAEDIYWLLALTAPNIKIAMRSRDTALGITENYLQKSYDILETVLSSGKQLTKQELWIALQKGKVNPDSAQLYHILVRAELAGLICSGAMQGKEQTYALLAERVPRKKTFNKDSALKKLAKIYFTSHGPATLQDFVWWSGLSTTEARKGLELARANILSEKIGAQTYYFAKTLAFADTGKVYLLPAFDEFIISYRDRSPALASTHHTKAISSNGMFRPVIVKDGQVIGIWKRITKKNNFILEMNLFQSINKRTKELLETEAVAYGLFFNKRIENLKYL